jgi:hypothetical protein
MGSSISPENLGIKCTWACNIPRHFFQYHCTDDIAAGNSGVLDDRADARESDSSEIRSTKDLIDRPGFLGSRSFRLATRTKAQGPLGMVQRLFHQRETRSYPPSETYRHLSYMALCDLPSRFFPYADRFRCARSPDRDFHLWEEMLTWQTLESWRGRMNDDIFLTVATHFPAGGKQVTLAKEIVERVQRLPEPLQAEVLDFVEFLLAKTSGESGKEENRRWMEFSLQSALRGMEDEPELYADTDVKERFQ